MSGLHFGGQYISYEELAHSNPSSSNLYFDSILGYCKAYLLGKQVFPVKTSGSTGKPKTILLNREQLKLSAQMTINALSLTKEYKGLVCLSTDHIGGKMMLIRGMELGMELYIIEPTADVSSHHLPPIDFVAMVPLQLKALLMSDSGRNFLSQCKAVIIGGSPIDPLDESQLEQFQSPIYQTFGMTETVSHIALRRLNGPQKELYFRAFKELHLSLDERGCLVICGAITNNVPVSTNDLVELVQRRKFKWLGRIDQVINSGGYKIHPQNISPSIFQVIRSIGIQANFITIGLPDSKWGQKVTLVLETEDLKEVTKQKILIKLKAKLHPYEVPKSVEKLQMLPRTPTGKVDIGKLSRLLLR